MNMDTGWDALTLVMDSNHHNRFICLASVIGKIGENKHMVLKIVKHVKL